MATTLQAGREFSCLIVEDDVAFATMAAQVVRGEGGLTTLAKDLAEARHATANQSFDLVLLDNHLPDGKGYDFFDQLARRNPESPIVMITGMPDLSEAVALTRNGLFDYLTKPVSVEALAACVARAKLRLTAGDVPAQATEILRRIRSNARGHDPAPAGREAYRRARCCSPGETGAGKDLAARALHELTFPNANAPFIAVNCAALPAEMFESELFGAERGAYTGADKKRAGLVAAAAGGTSVP